MSLFCYVCQKQVVISAVQQDSGEPLNGFDAPDSGKGGKQNPGVNLIRKGVLAIIKTKKEMLDVIRRIGMEQPLICADEIDLRTMFENIRPAKEYEATIAIQEVKRCFKRTLMWFTAELKHPPKAVYFKLVTSDDAPMSLLEALQRIGQAAGEDTQCIFAYDQQPDIPKEQCHLKMLVA